MSTTGAGRGPSPPRREHPRTETLWWAGHEERIPEGVDWLSPREVARLETLRFTKRRTEYLLRRWVGKRAVAAAEGRDTEMASLARIELLNRLTGAPYVVIDGSEAPWRVSLSDRAGCAVAVVGATVPPTTAGDAGAPLGVDVEVVEPRSDAFVADFLTDAEQRWVRARDGADSVLGPDAAANLVWSAKEAVLKVLQVGLRADTRSVDITVDTDLRADGWARFAAARNDAPVVHGWWRRDGVYLLTVAGTRPGEPPARLPGGTDLASATPVHSWMQRPLVSPETRDPRPRPSPQRP